jgi:hypothetical protein
LVRDGPLFAPRYDAGAITGRSSRGGCRLQGVPGESSHDHRSIVFLFGALYAALAGLIKARTGLRHSICGDFTGKGAILHRGRRMPTCCPFYPDGKRCLLTPHGDRQLKTHAFIFCPWRLRAVGTKGASPWELLTAAFHQMMGTEGSVPEPDLSVHQWLQGQDSPERKRGEAEALSGAPASPLHGDAIGPRPLRSRASTVDLQCPRAGCRGKFTGTKPYWSGLTR